MIYLSLNLSPNLSKNSRPIRGNNDTEKLRNNRIGMVLGFSRHCRNELIAELGAGFT